ncbi:Rrf2 family transcriptional regulator [Thioalkalivibrio sp.]|uniref:Rrf2 family transcriptional regulator n=1 Tax=Thioalkalivibrio sp. TaxID=2093813 RepID=UPI0039767EFE
MKLTTRGRYAVTAILDVAMHSTRGPVSLAEVAERQRLSLSYLEQLFAPLRRHGLVRSSRGPGGGYRLNRDAAEITVADVILAVDEPVDVTRCGGLVNCNQDSRCLTHDLWVELSRQMQDFLRARSLADVLQRHLEARGEAPNAPAWQQEGRPSRRTIPITAAPAQAAGGGEV